MAQEEGRSPLLHWLGIAGGVLALLAFFGLNNYHQLAKVMGRPGSSSSSRGDAKTDPADAYVCSSVKAVIRTINTDPPAVADAKSTFYGNQSKTLDVLHHQAKNSTLQGHILSVRLDLTGLQSEWLGVAWGTGGNEQANIARTMAKMREDEGALASWCQAHTGTR